MSRFQKILIANRGEIACRIARTAHALGYRTVAVYSDADAAGPHVALADEAVCIGPAPAAESYLNSAALLDAARRTGAQAVHPGYGFLSENADFAQACLDAGLVFIGPSPQAIRAMGDKAQAKRRMAQAGVPTVPGFLGDELNSQSDERLCAEAAKLGFPLLVKAVAGGGGRGMRRADKLADMPEAIAAARREATSAFGDGTLMLERLIEKGRHIEIQVFADAHGNAVHLGERDCTAQRRRQKVIEEAPSPVVSAAMRAAMGRDAVAAAQAVGYQGAGTIEFIVDAQMRHYFLEMNTRLQVEHPVTEMITGLDLVEWQLRIAAGEPLPLRQDEIRFSGHAIEARLYAEDPYNAFAPQTGAVLHFRPQNTSHVRIDAGIVEGGSVTPYYDPMVAKFIAHGTHRDDAIRKLLRALEDTPLLGLNTNGRFLRDLLDHSDFRAARMHTSLLDDWATQPILQRPKPCDADWFLAAALLVSPPGQRAASVAGFDLSLRCGDDTRRLRIETSTDTLHIGDIANPGKGQALHPITIHAIDNGQLRYTQDGISGKRSVYCSDATVYLAHAAAVFVFTEVSAFPTKTATNDPRLVRAPVAGTLTRIEVAVGAPVEAGQTLAVIEAMKMEMRLCAAAAGTVTAIHARMGTQVENAAVLIELELIANESA
ncbi:MAG: acetyl-CoA carboxylase biotin carboxylase subunit [Rhodoferax sp.]|nr:acetyl-CoA carboxylase biotin carboxylase subunit [Rhodoferax sp.]